ncbi:MAG: Trk system potassium transporter TrkA [Lachnospiraceae bacterium]|nr:Trk system potassium transporter TrkA [Lachnospiraceae bacterium]
MNIIIAGCGGVGSTLAEQLTAEGHEVTILDYDSKNLQTVTSQYDVMGIQGNSTSYRAQLEAGVDKADLLIAVTNHDEVNMLTCLIAKKAGNCQTIARVRSPQYFTEIDYIRDELGLSMAVNPEFAAAQEISRLIQIPSALEVDTFAKGRVNLVKIEIPADSVLDQLMLADFSSKVETDALVFIVERDKEVYIPDGSFVLQAGDKIYITMQISTLNGFLNKIGIKEKPIKKVLLAGGGTLGYYLGKILTEARMQVKIIEQNEKRCAELSEILPKAMIINGNATDRQLLVEEDIETTDAVVAITNYDEENLLLALYANKVSNAKVITRINRLSFEDVIGGLPIGSTVTPKDITAEYIIRYVRSMQNSYGSNVETLYRMVDNKVEALEFNVAEDAKVTRATLGELRIKKNTLICCINRNKKIIRPTGRDRIMPGDSVIVVTTNRGLNGIDEILN